MTTEKFMISPVDTEAQDDGAWTEYEGVQLKIRRITNTDYRNHMMRHAQKKGRGRQGNFDIADMIDNNVVSEAVGRYIIADWKFPDDHPNPVPFSREMAVQLMINDPDCQSFVIDFANEMSNYHLDNVKKTLEKS